MSVDQYHSIRNSTVHGRSPRATRVNEEISSLFRAKMKKMGIDVAKLTVMEEEIQTLKADEVEEGTVMQLSIEMTEFSNADLTLRTKRESAAGKYRVALEPKQDYMNFMRTLQSLQAHGQGLFGGYGIGERVLNFLDNGRNQTLWRSLAPGELRSEGDCDPAMRTVPIELPQLMGVIRYMQDLSLVPDMKPELKQQHMSELSRTDVMAGRQPISAIRSP